MALSEPVTLQGEQVGQNQRNAGAIHKSPRFIFYETIKVDELVKSQLGRHPGESRGPERLDLTGFRLR